MSEMRRLREETRSPLARALLESADGDGSASGACDRALGALGLGAAGVVIAKGAALGRAGAAGAAPVSAAPVATKAGALFFLKWVGIGALGGAVAIGSVTMVQAVTSPPAGTVRDVARGSAEVPARPRSNAPSVPRADSVPAAVQSAPRSPAASSDALAKTRGPMEPPAPSSPAPAPPLDVRIPGAETTPARAPATPDSAPARSEPIAAQLQALSAIRAALAAKDPARALALLDAFDLHNPGSSLGEEATVLRVDALIDAGRTPEATALGGAFLEARPTSAYGEHIRSKLKSP